MVACVCVHMHVLCTCTHHRMDRGQEIGSILLPVQSLYAQCFKMPKLKTSEFGIRKGFLILDQEGASQEDGRPNLQIHLKKVQNSSFFYVKGRGNRRGKR